MWNRWDFAWVFFFVRIQRKSLLHFCRYSRFFLIVLQKKWPLCVGQGRRETEMVKLHRDTPQPCTCQVLHNNCQNLLCTYVGQEEKSVCRKESEQHRAASSALTFGQSSEAGQEHCTDGIRGGKRRQVFLAALLGVVQLPSS